LSLAVADSVAVALRCSVAVAVAVDVAVAVAVFEDVSEVSSRIKKCELDSCCGWVAE
jgi:hypothetical protein